MVNRIRIMLGLLLVAALAPLWAQQKVDFDNYELHYIVLNTTELQPDIAARYNITRSGRRAFINLSVLEKQPGTIAKAVEANVTAVQRNLLGQRANIPLTTIREGQAIYHLGDFLIFDQETIWFDLEVQVEGLAPFSFTFPQKVWRE